MARGVVMPRQANAPTQPPEESIAGDIQPALAIDRIIHEPARLVILAVLTTAAEVDFKFLEATTGLSKGNLSRQASKLEEAGYITIRKYFKGKKPATSYQITAAGRAAFAVYWDQMNALQKTTRAGG